MNVSQKNMFVNIMVQKDQKTVACEYLLLFKKSKEILCPLINLFYMDHKLYI